MLLSDADGVADVELLLDVVQELNVSSRLTAMIVNFLIVGSLDVIK